MRAHVRACVCMCTCVCMGESVSTCETFLFLFRQWYLREMRVCAMYVCVLYVSVFYVCVCLLNRFHAEDTLQWRDYDARTTWQPVNLSALASRRR
mmetsp:Transcript_19169/g.28207  ORF Transcript_19169/g.28207 Transcript_19169/m.28207 type:complete len:95 (+) Transcript_19169:1-285(+)